jgi:hypothetical protein
VIFLRFVPLQNDLITEKKKKDLMQTGEKMYFFLFLNLID